MIELDESRAEEAIDLLALAFDEDPAYRYFCSAERPGYRRRLRIVFRSAREPRSKGVCLETENPRNVPFYEHIGYRVIARNRYAGLEITTLFRPDG